jgi:hypothetical protein
MDRKSVVVGLLIAGLAVTGFTGATTAIDTLNGPDTLAVDVERINETHAAVSWATEKPTHGTLTTFTQHRCNGSWVGVKTINDSSFSRTHLVIAPIYALNTSQIQQTRQNVFATNNPLTEYMKHPPVRYKVSVHVHRNSGSGATKEILQRPLTQTC